MEELKLKQSFVFNFTEWNFFMDVSNSLPSTQEKYSKNSFH